MAHAAMIMGLLIRGRIISNFLIDLLLLTIACLVHTGVNLFRNWNTFRKVDQTDEQPLVPFVVLAIFGVIPAIVCM